MGHRYPTLILILIIAARKQLFIAPELVLTNSTEAFDLKLHEGEVVGPAGLFGS